MANYQSLALLKQDLTISTSAYDNYLEGCIDRAEKAIEREGVTLDLEDVADVMLLVQYAAYLWRSRKGEAAAMPRSLRWEIHNRYVKEHAEEA